MGIKNLDQSSFNQGEIGEYMEGRIDNAIYQRALKRSENWIHLPQGGLFRRPGFEYIADLSTTDSQNLRLGNFNFKRTQQYLEVWGDLDLKLFRDKNLVATVPTVFPKADVRELRWAQSGDTKIIVHPDYPPQELFRNGSDSFWSFTELTIDPLPYFRFNVSQTLTPSGTTGAINLTLSGTTGYWNAGHTDTINVKVGGGDVNITGLFQDATGGTALSSAGTAGNSFDGNFSTVTSAGTNGWVGYNFGGSATIVKTIGLTVNATQTLTLAFQTDDNDTFTSPTTIGTATVSFTAGNIKYIDVPNYAAESRFRILETGGEDLTVKELTLNKGLAATGTVVNTVTDTADAAWKEQAWGAHHGYPRSVSFLGNRIVFGGTRDEPGITFLGMDGDLFSFDDTATDATNAFARTLSTDQNHSIRDMKAEREGLVIFTSDGTFFGSGQGAPITPGNFDVQPQNNIGVSDVAVTEVDGDLVYNSSNKKEIFNFVFSFGRDEYLTDNKTTLAHHLFKDGTEPRAATGMRAFKDTQANIMFVPQNNGEMAMLAVDAAKEVLAWSRAVTYNPDGTKANIRDAQVVTTEHNAAIGPIDTLYLVVERTVDGVVESFIEAMSEDEIYLDHWQTGTNTNQEITGGVIAANGTGYAVDDVLTVSGGTAVTAATMTVLTVDGSGGVLTTKVTESGDYSVLPSNPVSVTGGSGSGATFTMAWKYKDKTNWSGVTTLPNSNISVMGDGFELVDSTVDGSGNFTSSESVITVTTGINYTSTAETLPLVIIENGQIIRGINIMPKEVVVNLEDSLALNINGYPVRFRQFGDNLLDAPLEKFTGPKRLKIKNKATDNRRSPTIEFTVDRPLPCTLLTSTVVVLA